MKMRLRRGDDAAPGRAGELVGAGQAEVLDAMRDAARGAERLVDVEHLIDRDVADRVRRDPPAARRAPRRAARGSSALVEPQHAALSACR